MIVAMFALTALVVFLERDRLVFGMALESLYSFQLAIYSDLLLLAATVVYIAHWWFTSKTVGRWATALATTGTAGIVASVLARWFEMQRAWHVGHVPLSDLYEVTCLFTAVTMAIYLAIESFYRNRSAGAFVMPIVSAAVLLNIWLLANGQASPNHMPADLDTLWLHAHVLANVIGYGAFTVAAGMGAFYLRLYGREVRMEVEYSTTIRMSPRLDLLERLMVNAVVIGYFVFVAATLLGSVWAGRVWDSYWSWEPKEVWALLVLVTYSMYFYFRSAHGHKGVRSARWAVAGFVATLSVFIIISLFFPGQHAFARMH
jgi:cytochrome c-type biogenesis protein CcsB